LLILFTRYKDDKRNQNEAFRGGGGWSRKREVRNRKLYSKTLKRSLGRLKCIWKDNINTLKPNNYFMCCHFSIKRLYVMPTEKNFRRLFIESRVKFSLKEHRKFLNILVKYFHKGKIAYQRIV
jgi:hypothetical protein